MTTLTDDKQNKLRLKTPSIVVVGKQDPWYESSVEMHKNYFAERTSKLMEYDVGHRLPQIPADLTTVAKEILRLYKQTTGEEGTLN